MQTEVPSRTAHRTRGDGARVLEVVLNLVEAGRRQKPASAREYRRCLLSHLAYYKVVQEHSDEDSAHHHDADDAEDDKVGFFDEQVHFVEGD